MITLIVIFAVSGVLLAVDHFKYILNDQAKALCWFVFIIHAILLVGSIATGKLMYFSPD
nr:MAG TPA_asm: hypothetical protein [Caudoviricetes sp.]